MEMVVMLTVMSVMGSWVFVTVRVTVDMEVSVSNGGGIILFCCDKVGRISYIHYTNGTRDSSTVMKGLTVVGKYSGDSAGGVHTFSKTRVI